MRFGKIGGGASDEFGGVVGTFSEPRGGPLERRA